MIRSRPERLMVSNVCDASVIYEIDPAKVTQIHINGKIGIRTTCAAIGARVIVTRFPNTMWNRSITSKRVENDPAIRMAWKLNSKRMLI